MSGDRIAALVGLLMALALVGANGGLRRLPRQRMLVMAAAWVVIIVVAAAVFARFQAHLI